jgi:hypothetical protein
MILKNGKLAHSKEQENPNLGTRALVDKVNVMIESTRTSHMKFGK